VVNIVAVFIVGVVFAGAGVAVDVGGDIFDGVVGSVGIEVAFVGDNIVFAGIVVVVGIGVVVVFVIVGAGIWIGVCVSTGVALVGVAGNVVVVCVGGIPTLVLFS